MGLNNNLYQTAKKYLGIPYRHMGRDRSGLDCLGLAHLFYQEFGIDIPDGDGKPYSDRWVKEDPERYLRGVLAVGKEASPYDLRPLDFVYFRMGRYICHGGVMLDRQHFIHSLNRRGVHISPLNLIWRRRLVGARRLVDDEP